MTMQINISAPGVNLRFVGKAKHWDAELALIRAHMPLAPIHQFSSGAVPGAEAAVSAITTGRGHGASQDTAVPAR